MSVINNALKELENKPSTFLPLGASGIVVERSRQEKSSFAWSGLLLLILVIFLTVQLINTGLFELTGREYLRLPVDLAKPQQSMSIEPLPIPVLPAEIKNSIQISGLQINETDEYMELEFQLEKRAHIFLKLTTGNKYVFHVKNAESGIDAPHLGDNPWLNNINVHKVKDGLDIEFETRNGVLVETDNVQLHQLYYWLIKLKKIPSSKTDKAKTSGMKKSQAPDQEQLLVADAVQQASNDKKLFPVKLEIKSTIKKSSESEQLNEAILAVKKGQIGKAKNLFKNLIDSEHDRQVRLYLLQLLEQQQDKIQLHKLLLESQNKYPDDSSFILFQANELFTSRRYFELIKLYGHKAKTISLINLVAASYQRTNQHDQAIRHYFRAIELDPKQYKLWISLGISQQQLGQNDAALESYKTALAGRINTESLKVFLQQRIRQLSNK